MKNATTGKTERHSEMLALKTFAFQDEAARFGPITAAMVEGAFPIQPGECQCFTYSDKAPYVTCGLSSTMSKPNIMLNTPLLQ